MAWENDRVVPVATTLGRDAAIARIKEIAREDGITGSFKVFYQDNLIANPTDLPEQVNMELVKVSAVLDNATR